MKANSKQEIELFETIIKMYKNDPNLALALIEDEEQMARFEKYQESKIDKMKTIESYFEEMESNNE